MGFGVVDFAKASRQFYWERGRLASNEREARKKRISLSEKARACAALRARRPRSQLVSMKVMRSHRGHLE